ncbi:hypothetical protein BASA62_006838 [Batrachochytrium salamandrivorans]|nr:hypothetical protein BASA62_006838 [Batrachochytrium salamandrivorans]
MMPHAGNHQRVYPHVQVISRKKPCTINPSMCRGTILAVHFGVCREAACVSDLLRRGKQVFRSAGWMRQCVLCGGPSQSSGSVGKWRVLLRAQGQVALRTNGGTLTWSHIAEDWGSRQHVTFVTEIAESVRLNLGRRLLHLHQLAAQAA